MSNSKYQFLNGKKLAEFHMLKLYPSSALNRDDAGEQKTGMYNGTLRNRISSQCIKRSWRLSETFEDVFDEIGIRTKRMPEYVGKKLVENGVPEEDVISFKKILSGEKVDEKSSKKSKADQAIDEGKPVKTAALSFYSVEELDKIAEICKRIYDDLEEPKSKNLKTIKIDNIQKEMRKCVHPMNIDVAAFGRMVTDNMLRPVEGAMQVAQALSTNAAVKENDYFVACDDLVKGETIEDVGGEMLGDIDYNSACYYIHANADLEQFAENLKDCENMEEIVKALPSNMVEVMAYTDPTARQSTMEAHVLPEVIYVELKSKKRPLNRMKAFAEPCNRNIAEKSAKKLADYINCTNEKADLGITNALWYCEDESVKAPENVTVVNSIKELEQKLNEWMNE
ncbi:CRISPR-associated protein, Cse4 family [Lachnospiraceae bacterium KH1T2]|nr:CRISPR-associated protein, Cse4 family [Lachnospiraceae bacterium KH1T2]